MGVQENKQKNQNGQEKKIYGYVEDDEVDQYEQFKNDFGIEKEREVTESLVSMGLEYAGYNGTKTEVDTKLMRLFERVIEVSGIAGLTSAAWGAGVGNTSMLYFGAVCIVVMGIFAFAHQVAQRKEPRISCRIRDRIDPRKDLCAEGGDRE